MKTERYDAIRDAVADMLDEQAEEAAERAKAEAEWNEWEAEYRTDCIDGWRGTVYEDPDQIIDDDIDWPIEPRGNDPWYDDDAAWRDRVVLA